MQKPIYHYWSPNLASFIEKRIKIPLGDAGFRFDYDELFEQFVLTILCLQHKRKIKDLNLLGLAIWHDFMKIKYTKRKKVVYRLVQELLLVRRKRAQEKR